MSSVRFGLIFRRDHTKKRARVVHATKKQWNCEEERKKGKLPPHPHLFIFLLSSLLATQKHLTPLFLSFYFHVISFMFFYVFVFLFLVFPVCFHFVNLYQFWKAIEGESTWLPIRKHVFYYVSYRFFYPVL